MGELWLRVELAPAEHLLAPSGEWGSGLARSIPSSPLSAPVPP